MRAAFTNNLLLWKTLRDAVQAGCGSEGVYTDIFNQNSELWERIRQFRATLGCFGIGAGTDVAADCLLKSLSTKYQLP